MKTVWVIVVIFILSMATSVAAQESECVIQGAGVNIRSLPSLEGDIVGTLNSDGVAAGGFVVRDEAIWYLALIPVTNVMGNEIITTGWVSSTVSDLEGDCENLADMDTEVIYFEFSGRGYLIFCLEHSSGGSREMVFDCIENPNLYTAEADFYGEPLENWCYATDCRFPRPSDCPNASLEMFTYVYLTEVCTESREADGVVVLDISYLDNWEFPYQIDQCWLGETELLCHVPTNADTTLIYQYPDMYILLVGESDARIPFLRNRVGIENTFVLEEPEQYPTNDVDWLDYITDAPVVDTEMYVGECQVTYDAALNSDSEYLLSVTQVLCTSNAGEVESVAANMSPSDLYALIEGLRDIGYRISSMMVNSINSVQSISMQDEAPDSDDVLQCWVVSIDDSFVTFAYLSDSRDELIALTWRGQNAAINISLRCERIDFDSHSEMWEAFSTGEMPE